MESPGRPRGGEVSSSAGGVITGGQRRVGVQIGLTGLEGGRGTKKSVGKSAVV